jgi:hypothetical protein
MVVLNMPRPQRTFAMLQKVIGNCKAAREGRSQAGHRGLALSQRCSLASGQLRGGHRSTTGGSD